MKKFLRLFYLVIAIFIITSVAIMGILQYQKYVYEKQLKYAQSQVENYNKYKFASIEYTKLKKSEKDEIYYYGADGKRYVFPDVGTYNTWFPIMVKDINTYSLEKLYETPLRGNVTCRPGTLIQTPTDPNIYIVIKNGQIRPFNDKNILKSVYGENWQKLVLEIPNYYFTNYQITSPINSMSYFPAIPENITIDQDKDLKQP